MSGRYPVPMGTYSDPLKNRFQVLIMYLGDEKYTYSSAFRTTEEAVKEADGIARRDKGRLSKVMVYDRHDDIIVKEWADDARTKYGEVYSVRYVHAITPSSRDVGDDVILPAGAFASSSTLAKALRERGVLSPGGRIKNFRVQGDKVVVFPGKNSTSGGGSLTANWHSIVLTHVESRDA
jgi:hypothetical protein